MAGTLVRRLLTSRVGCPLRQYCSPAATTTPSAGGGQSQPANVTQEEEAGSEDQIFSKVDIELRAHQPDVLESYNWFATTAARHLNVSNRGIFCELFQDYEANTLSDGSFKVIFGQTLE